MANLNEISVFEAGIYQLETVDPVLGGPGGIANLQAQLLANRTKYLKEHVDALETAAPGLATQAYVQAELEKLDHKQSVRVATTSNITLSGTQTIDGITVSAGDRVLVKNQTTQSQNGIYVVSGSGWSRAVDANDSAEVTPGLIVHVEDGTAQANQRWQLTTNGPIVLGTSTLTFADITTGFAPIQSPNFTGNPSAPTPTPGDNDTSLATTAFVEHATGGLSTVSAAGGTDTVLTAVEAGAAIVVLTGALTANKNVVFPTQTGQWSIINNTTGAFDLTAKTAAGTGVILPPGQACSIVGDGTNISILSSNGGATGGGSDKVFWQNAQVITKDHTVPAGVNAGSFGPITILDGVTVTVDDGATWTIV